MNIKNKIKITVNGKQIQIIPKFSLKSLITKLNMPLNKIAIELSYLDSAVLASFNSAKILL